MIIWVIWLIIFDWLLFLIDYFMIICDYSSAFSIFDDYLWLFVCILDYLMIIWLIIWWLFFRILHYLMVIWCLFDDNSNYFKLMIICHFVQAHCSAHSSATAISLSCWACLQLWATNYRQKNLKPGGDGEEDTESSTGLWFGTCSCPDFAAVGQSAWSLAMNADQRLGGTLRSCLLQKACCGSYRQKWENGQRTERRTWT